MDEYNDPYTGSPNIGPNPRSTQDEETSRYEELGRRLLDYQYRTEKVFESIRNGLWAIFSLLLVSGVLLGIYLISMQSFVSQDMQPFLTGLETYMNDIYGCNQYDSCGIVTLFPYSPNN